MLPMAPRFFTGRRGELGWLMNLAQRESMTVAAVEGTAGVGKTALVVHAAHLLRPEFPGGCLYAELRGCDTAGQYPAEPEEVLKRFLRRLGVGGKKMPTTLEERSAMLRELLATRPTLLVLDDAASEAQVRPLLPGAGASLVLITSRSVLAGLDLDSRIDLDVLPGHEAEELLARMAGQERMAAEPKAVADVLASCGGLPLALVIAGKSLNARQARPVEWLAESLLDERRRLDQLAVPDQQVRAVFEVSYRQLAEADARMFRLLGLHPGPDFDEDIAASLAGFDDLKVAGSVLDRLAAAHLIIAERAGRFRLQGLLLLFAREISDEYDDEADRIAAQKRLARYFTDMAWYLDICLDPRQRPTAEADTAKAGGTLPSQREILEKFETERENLLAIVRLAAEHGWHDTVQRLSEYMGDALTLLRHLDDLLAVRQAALTAASSTGNTAARGAALGNLGNAYAELRRLDDAIACLTEDLAICCAAEDRRGEGQALGNLGVVYGELYRFKDAIDCYERAISISKEVGDKHSEGQTLDNLGNAYLRLRRFEDAADCYLAALRIKWDTDDRRGEGQTRNNLGVIYRNLGKFDDAIDCFEEDLAICRRLGDKHGESQTLGNLGNTYHEMYRFDDAIACYQKALTICRETGDRHGAGQVFGNLAIAYLGKREPGQAVSCLRNAASAMREAGDVEAATRYEKAASTVPTRRRRRHR